jgi:hypothetical protein
MLDIREQVGMSFGIVSYDIRMDGKEYAVE